MFTDKRQQLVSVIVPNYNHAQFLEQRLESIFNQTYTNFEVIFLDDCSTDNSVEIAQRYKSNPHLKSIIINEHNSGSTFQQWNKGFSLAKGEIIWIAESDDYCEINMLEELVKAYTHSDKIVLAYSTLKMVDMNGVLYRKRSHSRPNRYMSGKDFVCKCLTPSNIILNASCAIFSRKAALKVRENYMKFKGAGDYLFWTEIAMQGDIAIVDKKLNYFRRAGSSVTDKNFASGIAAVEDMEVLKYIDSICHLSPLRKRIAYANHAKMLSTVKYLDEKIRRKNYDLWEVESHLTIFDSFLLWFQKNVRSVFNIYI